MNENPSWITPSGVLFTASEAVFTSTQVVASGTNVTYKLISGEFPAGLSMSNTGTISGTPSPVTNKSRSTFVLRAQNTQTVVDRVFSIDVTGVTPIYWDTSHMSFIGTDIYLNIGTNGNPYGIVNQYVNFKFSAITNYTLSPGANLTYYIDDTSTLPAGLSLDPSGVLSGFIQDTLDIGDNLVEIPRYYKFKVYATDSVTTISQYFSLLITSQGFIKNPNPLWLPPNFIINQDLSYIPPLQFISNSDLGIVKSQNNITLDVSAYDPDPTTGYTAYEVTGTNLSIVNYLTLDTNTGILYGAIPYRPAYLESNHLIVTGKKYINSTHFTATTNQFLLTVQGYTDYSIKWESSSDLGKIVPGETSTLEVVATQSGVNKFNIVYTVVSGELPNGLVLNSDGSISGKVSYSESPGIFKFTVSAKDIYNISSIEQEFSITVERLSTKEYTQIYCSPLLSLESRDKYSAFVLNSDIFDASLIYRYFDPSFGVQLIPKLHLEFSIELTTLAVLTTALTTNFKKRRVTLGDLKVAYASDSSGTPLYEVIYSDVIDNLTNNDGDSVSLSVEFDNGTVYPPSLDNMRYRLSKIQLPDQSIISVTETGLPVYMKSSQEPGYMNVMPICYVKPGHSKKIIKKIKASGIKFNEIDFHIDRVIVETPEGPKYLLLKR